VRILYRRKQRTICLAFGWINYKLAVSGRTAGPRKGRVDVWDIPGGDKPVSLASLEAPPQKMVFSVGGELVVDLSNRIERYSGTRYRTVEVVREWDRNEYTKTSWSPDGRWLVLDNNSLVRLIDLRPPFPEVWSQPAPGGRNTGRGAAFSPDGRWLAVAAKDTVEIWEAATGLRIATWDKPAPTERWFGFALSWSPDGRWVCETWQQWVNVWDAATGKPVFQRVAQNEWINDTAFHQPSGRLAIAIAGRTDGVVGIYAPEDWREERAYAWPVGRVEAVAFHPEGDLAAVGGDRPEVVGWDVDW
jgi:WD40 repeat protein